MESYGTLIYKFQKLVAIEKPITRGRADHFAAGVTCLQFTIFTSAILLFLHDADLVLSVSVFHFQPEKRFP